MQAPSRRIALQFGEFDIINRFLLSFRAKQLYKAKISIILREFVEQIRVSNIYTTDEQLKRVKIREIEIVYNFIGAFDFEEAREQSQRKSL